MAELRVIGKKSGLPVAPDRCDYDVHGLFTVAAKKRSVIAKFIHKALDGKFAAAIRRFSAAQTETDLEELWLHAWTNRDIPGAYWALITHPATTNSLVERAFGEVHMLSHISGASRLVEAREFDELTACVTRLTNEGTMLRRRLAARDKALNRLAHLKHDLAAQKSENDRLRSRVTELESGSEVASLRESVRQLSNRAEGHARRAEKLADDLRAERARVEEVRRRRPPDDMAVPISIPERARDHAQRAQTQAANAEPDESRCETAETPDLLGKRVLYVGGRPGTVVHLRSLIEQHNGAFLYHDGGKEERDARLNDVLSQADLVVCPTDCVSHAACLKAKSFCKMAKKPFIILRTASRSSLANRLSEISMHVA